MKKQISSLIKAICVTLIVILSNTISAQAPQKFNYQAVARNSTGALLQNQPIAVQLTVRDSANGGVLVYQETHSVTTNQFGLFTLLIGKGIITHGTFDSISWGTGSKYLNVAIDPTGGTSYTDMGTTELVSVPYALYAGNVPAGASAWDTAYSNTFDTLPGNVGIGTASPREKLEINGNIILNGQNNRQIYLSSNDYVGWGLTVSAGACSGSSAGGGGDLVLSGGDQFQASNTFASFTGGNVIIASGGNQLPCNTCTNGGYISVRIGGSNYSQTEAMHIDANANIGIGNSQPAAKLHVSGSVLLGDSGTVINTFQNGTVAIGGGNAGVNSFIFTFPHAFASPPSSVVVTARNSSTFTDMFAISTTNITATSVQLNIYRVDNSGGSWSQNLIVDWIAIQ